MAKSIKRESLNKLKKIVSNMGNEEITHAKRVKLFSQLICDQIIEKELIADVDKKKKEPSMGVMLMRTFIVQGLLSSFIAIMTILFLDRKAYSLFNGGINMITGIFIIVCALMILYRKDKRGLHDIMAGSFVVKEEN